MSATMTSHCSSAVDVFIGDFWAFNRKPTLILADYGERLSSTSMWLSAMESMEKVTNNAELHLCCQQENVNVSTSAWATMAKASSELRKYAEATNQLTAVAPSPAPMGRQAAETPSLLPDSVDFGFNGTAAYWLQTIPVAIAQDNGCSIDPMDFPEGDQRRSALVEQAAADWENYLNERIREMAANSFHLALVLAVDGQGNRTGRNGKQKSPVDELCAIWKQLVTDEEFKHTIIPAYSRTVTEVLAPFEKPQRTIDQADKINVEMCQLIQTECPHRLAYLGSGDAVKFARELSKDVRVWCESIFLSALDLHRNDSEKRSLIDQLFACLEQRIAQDANSYAMEYEHVLLLIRKN